MQLHGAHVFLVGGSTGVGAALSRQLAKEGAKLTVLALDDADLAAVGDETGATTIGADLAVLHELDGMVARVEAGHGPIDLLVCMAAICPSGAFQDYTAETLRDTVTINTISHMELVRQALPGMIARGRGTITVTGSLSTEVTMIHLGCYVPSKLALTKFGLDLNDELRDYGIRVFAFLLGSVKGTPLATKAAQDPVVGFLEKRAGDVGVLTPEAVADRMVEVVKSNRKGGAVGVPKLSQPMLAYKALPGRIMNPLVVWPSRRHKRKLAG